MKCNNHNPQFTHGSLFSGIGGFDLAAEWMGWENKFHCEWNEFGKKVLNHYWPKAISYDDITKTDFTIHRGTIDVLSGGFPCQPYSQAGKRLGKEDDRHLWPEMLRAIREIQPSWVVGENVRGLTNWNGGLVFDEVQADLEAEGYEVTPFLLPACAVNAPHRRDRIWFVAYSMHCGDRQLGESAESEGFRSGDIEKQKGRTQHSEQHHQFSELSRDATDPYSIRGGRLRDEIEETGTHQSDELSGSQHRISDDKRIDSNSFSKRDTPPRTSTETEGERCFRIEGKKERGGRSERINGLSGLQRIDSNSFSLGLRGQSDGTGETGFFDETSKIDDWSNFPTQSPICDGNDGISSRLDGITFSKWRNESIKAGGNAIVPQVVYAIFKSIQKTTP